MYTLLALYIYIYILRIITYVHCIVHVIIRANLIMLELLKYNYVVVPSCYVTSDCSIGIPINSTSISLPDCCTHFGASYHLNGQCHPCPTTSE